MSILSGYEKYKRHLKIDDENYKLVSEWTHADTVEMSDGSSLTQKIDDMTSSYREKHLNRMREGKCSEEACVLYSELLTDFERIGDHVLNVAQSFSKIHTSN